MGSVNRVWLMGWVARPPMVEEGRCRLVVATRDGEHIERNAVTASGGLAHRAAELRTGDAVYVEGQLEHDGGIARVAAEELWRVNERLMEAEVAEGSVSHGTHTSPRPHERRGHWRRVSRDTPVERLVWVSQAMVGLRGRGTSLP